MKKNFLKALAGLLMGTAMTGHETAEKNEKKTLTVSSNAKPMELSDVLMPRFVMGPDDFGIRWINSGHFDRNARMRRSQRYNHHKK